MPYRDYEAPGVTVIVQRDPAQENASLIEFYPVFIGTGMTSRSRKFAFSKATADVTNFPKVTFEVDLSGMVDSQMFDVTTFSLSKLTIEQVIGGVTTPTILVKPTDYTEVDVISSVRADGQALVTINIVKAGITDTDLVYDLEVTAVNTDIDFEPRLVLSDDAFNAADIFGPKMLKELTATFRNDIAFAAEIAFRMQAPAFYYLEVPRDYGAAALEADFVKVIETIYFKKNAYRIIALSDNAVVATAIKTFINAISNPLDQRPTVGLVSYPVASITNINDIEELKEKVGGYSQTTDAKRISNVFCGTSVELKVGTDKYVLPPYFMNVAIASLDTTLGMALPLSKRTIDVFSKINVPRFRPKQWNELAAMGVWIVYQNDPSDPITIRHQLTTSQSGIAEDQEYSLVKNVDAVNMLFTQRLDPYSGRYNQVDGYLERLDAATTATVEEAKELGLAKDIILLTKWQSQIVPPQNGQPEKLKLVTRYRLVPAYPANNLDVYLLI